MVKSSEVGQHLPMLLTHYAEPLYLISAFEGAAKGLVLNRI